MLFSPAFPPEKRGLSKLRTRDFPPRKDSISYRSPVRLTSRRPSSSPRVCTDSVRLVVRSYADVITKFSRLDGLPIFLIHGASLARFARRSSANMLSLVLLCRRPTWDIVAGTVSDNAVAYVNIYRPHIIRPRYLPPAFLRS